MPSRWDQPTGIFLFVRKVTWNLKNKCSQRIGRPASGSVAVCGNRVRSNLDTARGHQRGNRADAGQPGISAEFCMALQRGMGVDDLDARVKMMNGE